MLALALVLEPWLAALIVGAGLLVVAGILGMAGRARVRAIAPPVPDQALRSVSGGRPIEPRGQPGGSDHGT